MGFFSRRWRDIIRRMVQIFMPSKELFLAKRLIAHAALEGLLVGVDQHVRLEVPRGRRRIRTQSTAEAFFALVCFRMNLKFPIRNQLIISKFKLTLNE